jgi:PKD repeat protein
VFTQSVAVVNVPPVASFVSTCDGLTCTFNASSSIDVDGTIASYAWNFGDTTVGTGVSLSHAYMKGGTYRVALRVGRSGRQYAGTVLTVVPADIHR